MEPFYLSLEQYYLIVDILISVSSYQPARELLIQRIKDIVINHIRFVFKLLKNRNVNTLLLIIKEYSFIMYYVYDLIYVLLSSEHL